MKIVGLQTFIWSNRLKSILLLILFPILLGVVIFAIYLLIALGLSDGPFPLALELISNTFIYVIIGSLLWFAISWLIHNKLIFALTHARPLERTENMRVYNIVENLCISRGVKLPKIYIIEDDSLNAFATGLSINDAAITFSRGIVNKLNDTELEAVAAHELTHILNEDIRLMMIAIVFVGVIQTLSEFALRVNFGSSDDDNKGFAFIALIKLVVFLIGFLFVVIVQLAISRKREFLADAGAVELTKSSDPLISALLKISQDPYIEAVENKNVAQMFIENPIDNKKNFLGSLFSTHPSIEERINALKQIG